MALDLIAYIALCLVAASLVKRIARYAFLDEQWHNTADVASDHQAGHEH